MITIAILTILAQQAAGTVSGRVTDSLTHQPIRGALVTSVGGSRDVTGDDGRYTINHPTGPEVHIRVAIAGYSTLETTSRFGDGDFLKLDLELHLLARIAGKVVDKETGEPIERVLSIRRAGGGGQDEMPDKDGAFETRGIEPGDYTLGLRQDGDAIISWDASGKPDSKKPHHSYGAAIYPATIHVEEREKQFVEMRLAALPSHRVTGSIEVPTGRESEAVTLTLWHRGTALPVTSRPGTSGAFRIDGLTSGEYGLIAELGKGAEIAFGRESFNITDHDIGSLKLTLSPAASVTGTVRMAEENTAIPADLEVWLNSASGWGSCAGFCLFLPSPSLLPAPGFVRIFRKPIPVVDGRFRADGIAPDDYWPELFTSAVNVAGIPALHGLPHGFAVLSGDDRPIGIYGGAQVDFVLTSKPGAVAGVVQDGNQSPVAGATVTLVPASDSRRQSTTMSGQSGEFIFRNLAPGKYKVNGVLVEVGFGQTVSLVVATGTP